MAVEQIVEGPESRKLRLETLIRLRDDSAAWRELDDKDMRITIRRLLGEYVTYVRGRRPRLLPYLGS